MLQRFLTWYRTPATRKDRVIAAIIGAMGGFWIGALGRIIFGAMPVSFSVVGWWALASAVTGVVLGLLFPKTITCVCYPFSTFGVTP